MQENYWGASGFFLLLLSICPFKRSRKDYQKCLVSNKVNTGLSVSAIQRGLANKSIRQPGRSSKHHHLARITLFRRAEAAWLHSPYLEDNPLTNVGGNQFSALFLLVYGKTWPRASISHTSIPETSGLPHVAASLLSPPVPQDLSSLDSLLTLLKSLWKRIY